MWRLHWKFPSFIVIMAIVNKQKHSLHTHTASVIKLVLRSHEFPSFDFLFNAIFGRIRFVVNLTGILFFVSWSVFACVYYPLHYNIWLCSMLATHILLRTCNEKEWKKNNNKSNDKHLQLRVKLKMWLQTFDWIGHCVCSLLTQLIQIYKMKTTTTAKREHFIDTCVRAMTHSTCLCYIVNLNFPYQKKEKKK